MKDLFKRSNRRTVGDRTRSRLRYEPLEPRQLLAALEILAAGTTNQERISLQIDGQTVQTWENLGGDAYGGQFESLSLTVDGTVTADQVRITFENDLYDPANNFDRNVRVDALIIDGQRFETESPLVYSTGTWRPDDGVTAGFRESEFLHTDGYFQYATDGGNQGDLIEIIASGDRGEEQFELLIDQRVVAAFTATTEFETYAYRADGVITPDQIRVRFVNDLYEPDLGIDRNLNVDAIRVAGVVYETEDPSVFSTGTWLPADGVAPGYRLSQTLHADGYFEYGRTPEFGALRLETSVINVLESDNAVQIRILREQGTDGDVSVDYSTLSDSATPGEDYVETQGTATIADGQQSVTVVVPILEDDLVESDEQFRFAIDNVTGGASLLAPRTATITIDDNDTVQSGGDGLLGEYFDERGFLSRFENRVDATVNFDWGNQAPLAGMGPDSFSVRWTGQVEPRFTETYTFRTVTDDGVRLWVDNQLIIDQWVDQSATAHEGTIALVAGQRYDIRMEMYERGVFAVAQLYWASPSQPLEIIPQSQLYAADPPPPEPGDQLQNQILVSGLVQPTAIDFVPDGSRYYVAEQRGVVRVVENGNLLDEPFLDFRARVNGVRDRGLLDIAVHPDFEQNPYVYLLYTYDPPEVFNQAAGSLAGPDGVGNRAGRLTRVTADASNGYRTIVPDSEVVLVGNNSTWENFNGFVNSTSNFSEPPAGILPDGSNLQDFIASDSESHTVASLDFGPDGALYVSIGDGTSYNRVDPRTVRVQDIDNLSGKVLRVDPITGRGLSDNPFFRGDLDENRAKVYQLGLRNPFRISVDDVTGRVYVGDVGWTTWEEINGAGPGANFGWPYFEGGNGTSLRTRQYENLPEAQAFYASGEPVTASLLALNHSTDGINAIVLGDVYNGTAFPEEYRGDLFFNDLGQGIVRHADLDADGNIVNVQTFTTGARIVVQITQGPDGNLYYVDLDDGTIGRWVFPPAEGQGRVAGTPVDQAPLVDNGSVPGGQGVVIANIDAGSDLDHVALADRWWRNPGEIAGDGIDNDQNGYVDDVFGYDFVDGDSDPGSASEHGTLTAGILVADGSRGGLSGMAEGARVMTLRALAETGQGSTQSIARAIVYAVDHGANVINLPAQTEPSAELQSAIRYAGTAGVLIVAAAGNEGADTPAWSAALSATFDHVLSAGATDAEGRPLPDANRVGDSGAVQLDAVGVRLGTLPADEWGGLQGTSAAAATVSGAAALVWSRNPALTATQVRDLLVATATPVGGSSDAAGQLDVAAAVARAEQSLSHVLRTTGQRLDVWTGDLADNIEYVAGQTEIRLNGIRYALPSGLSQVVVQAGLGEDRIRLLGSQQDDALIARPGFVRMGSPSVVFRGYGLEVIDAHAGGGRDYVWMEDTPGSDELTVTPERSLMLGDGYVVAAADFETVRAVSRAGQDQVLFVGTEGTDRVVGKSTFSRLRSGEFIGQVAGFASSRFELGDGFDPVILYGGDLPATLELRPDAARFSDRDFVIDVAGLDRTTSYAGPAADEVTMVDGPGQDVLNARPGNSLLVGVGYDHRVYGFESTRVISSGGSDRATLTGTVADEDWSLRPLDTRMAGSGYELLAEGFPSILAFSGGGVDSGLLQGSAADDQFYFDPGLTHWTGAGYSVTAIGIFDQQFDGGGGRDSVILVDGSGDDRLVVRRSTARLSSDDYELELGEFEELWVRSLVDASDDVLEIEQGELDFEFGHWGDWRIV